MNQPKVPAEARDAGYDTVRRHIAAVRKSAPRSAIAVRTAAHWMIGRHVVEFEQSAAERAAYATTLNGLLPTDPTHRFPAQVPASELLPDASLLLIVSTHPILQTVYGESAQPPARTSNLQMVSGESESTRTLQ